MEAVGRLAGGVAHDFNNLLTVDPRLHASSCCAGAPGDEPLRADARARSGSAADARGALTRQLLAFSRQQVLQPRLLDLNERRGGRAGADAARV